MTRVRVCVARVVRLNCGLVSAQAQKWLRSRMLWQLTRNATTVCSPPKESILASFPFSRFFSPFFSFHFFSFLSFFLSSLTFSYLLLSFPIFSDILFSSRLVSSTAVFASFSPSLTIFRSVLLSFFLSFFSFFLLRVSEPQANILRAGSEGHPVLFPSFQVPRTFAGMLLCVQPTHAYGCFGSSS